MKLNTEAFTYRGEKYEIRELTVGQLMPMLNKLAEDTSGAQYEIMKMAVWKDGKAIGDDAESLPGGMLLPLLQAVSRLNALTSQSEEGNA